MSSEGLVEPDDQTAAPAIVMVASGTEPASLVLPANAELGRRIAAVGASHEVVDDRMSRDHATVRWERGTWVITDLDSRNGTFVNGERVTREARRRGDVIVRLGGTVFALLADGRGQPAPAREAVVGPELARAYEQIGACAATGDTLLVLGEPGSGKDAAARQYHETSPRSGGPFVAVNCAAIPDGVADRMLFGGRKGAIETIGHYQLARGGTLFLDDIAELAHGAQIVLWRVLEMGQARVDSVGVVCAGQDLRTAIADGRLLDELYRLLAKHVVELPPLRARKVDIARLVQREIAEHATKAGRPLAPHPKLVEACCTRVWPGNIRELRAALHHAAMQALALDRDVVRAEDLPEDAGMPIGTVSGETAVERPRNAAPRALDKRTIATALVRANGVVSVAARSLGLHRSQLYKLLDEHGIAHEK